MIAPMQSLTLIALLLGAGAIGYMARELLAIHTNDGPSRTTLLTCLIIATPALTLLIHTLWALQ